MIIVPWHTYPLHETENHMQTKWTTLPSDVALQCPAWASDETRQLAADAAQMFAATKAARAESDRLRDAVGDVDPMTTSVSDLTGAAATARQSQLEAWRDEVLARSKFAEYLSALERDRARAERESADAVDQARRDAKDALLSAGVADLSEAMVNRGGGLAPDGETRAAFDRIISSFQPVVEAGTLHREAKSLGSSLASRDQDNARHRAETEKALRTSLERMATAAVG